MNKFTPTYEDFLRVEDFMQRAENINYSMEKLLEIERKIQSINDKCYWGIAYKKLYTNFVKQKRRSNFTLISNS